MYVRAVNGSSKIHLQAIHANGMLAGISIKPGTAVESVLPFVSRVDTVLVMTVEPGFGGS
jgi:ribulose-phosphate 3-epimerase